MQHKIDMGLALLEMEFWHKISLGDDFTILSERKELEETLKCRIEENFMSLFDLNSQNSIRKMAAGITPDRVGSSILFTKNGMPVEILLVRHGENLEVFLQNIENRLRSLEHLTIFYRHFLTTPIAICYTDREARIIDANRSFLDLYGYRLEEVVGQKPSILKSCRQSPTVYGEMWASLMEGSSGKWSGQIINRCKNGEERTVHLTISAVRTSRGDMIGFVASAIDISREKRLEDALKANLEDSIALSKLWMAVTSNDMKGKLDSIVDRALLIQETINVISHDKLLEHVGRIISDCYRMADCLSNVAELEEIESGKVQLVTTRVHLNCLLRSCIDTNSASAGKKAIRISLDVQAIPQPVRVEAVKIEHVFNILIDHAVQSSPPGSILMIVYRDCPEGKLVELRALRPSIAKMDEAEIHYLDGQIQKGAGLMRPGLHFAKRIIELHGGTFSFDSQSSDGCIFSVVIPTDRPVVSGRDIAALIHDPPGVIFKDLEELLSAHEVRCFITRNAFEAKRILLYEKPELVFFEEASLCAEVRDLMVSVRATLGPTTEYILVAPEEPACPDPLFDHVLVKPVLDFEVLELLRYIGLDLTGKAAGRAFSTLIVDDDETTHETVGGYLRMAGYKVRHAYGLTDALNILTSAVPDLILLNVRIPDMEAQTLLAAVKNKTLVRNVPVIFLTDQENLNISEKGMELDAEDFITRPFNKLEVLARVRATLHRSAKYRKIEGRLEGTLADIGLPDLLQTLEIGRKSARVDLGDMDGEIYIADGKFVLARQGAFHGEEAFHRLFFLGRGRFNVCFGVDHQEPQGVPIAVQSLLMSTAAYIDEVMLLLSCLPSERFAFAREQAADFAPEFSLLHTSFPCSLKDLIVLMTGTLKQNAERIVAACRDGKLRVIAGESEDEPH